MSFSTGRSKTFKGADGQGRRVICKTTRGRAVALLLVSRLVERLSGVLSGGKRQGCREGLREGMLSEGLSEEKAVPVPDGSVGSCPVQCSPSGLGSVGCTGIASHRILCQLDQAGGLLHGDTVLRHDAGKEADSRRYT